MTVLFTSRIDDSDSEEMHGKVRLKATQKSKEYREKTRKRVPKESLSEVATNSEGYLLNISIDYVICVF